MFGYYDMCTFMPIGNFKWFFEKKFKPSVFVAVFDRYLPTLLFSAHVYSNE